jgi:hypothetical protein
MQILNLKKNLENNLADLTQVKLYNIIRSNWFFKSTNW